MATWLRVLILSALALALFVVWTLYRAFSRFPDAPMPGDPVTLSVIAAAFAGFWYWTKKRLPKAL